MPKEDYPNTHDDTPKHTENSEALSSIIFQLSPRRDDAEVITNLIVNL